MTTFDTTRFWQAEWAAHHQTAQDTEKQLQGAFDAMLAACLKSLKAGGKIFFFGNGGSAADAQHLATELTVRYKTDRAPIAALALTTDTSSLTAIGNDFGFEYLFSRQLEALARAGDVAIAISTSGNSPNVLKALEVTKKLGVTSVGFTGGTGGKMISACDIVLKVPSATTARIQEMHIAFGQMLCGALEQSLGLVPVDHPAGQAA